MKQISNKTLLVLAIIVISLTFMGVWFSLTRVPNLITSAAVGFVNITINETVGITLRNQVINFTASNPGDDKESNDSSDVTTGLDLCAATDDTCNFNVTNDGSVNINITLTTNTELFTSATMNSTHYRCSIENHFNTTGDQFGYCVGSNTTWFDCSLNGGAANATIPCITNLNYTNNRDSALVRIRVNVPSDEPSGKKNNTITFTGSKA
jgi:hypothetical protein